METRLVVPGYNPLNHSLAFRLFLSLMESFRGRKRPRHLSCKILTSASRKENFLLFWVESVLERYVVVQLCRSVS